MSEFICNYTIAFTAAWYYGQFVAQALIRAHRAVPHSTYAMMYLIWHRDARNCLLDISNVTGKAEREPISSFGVSVIDEKRFSKKIFTLIAERSPDTANMVCVCA